MLPVRMPFFTGPKTRSAPALERGSLIIEHLALSCETVQRLGYAMDDEEEEIGVRCIGAPVRNSSGEIIAAISVSGTKSQLENVPAMAVQVVAVAAALTRQINGFSVAPKPPSHALDFALQVHA